MNDDIIQQQIAYYRARASEYDEWFYRLGRYDRGEALNRAWLQEAALLVKHLHELPLVDRILELAGGTGIWTQELVKMGKHVTVVDASEEMIAINRRKVDNPAVRYQQADLFIWEPAEVYDMVFFSFWLSHVPPERFDAFMSKVGRALHPGGFLFIIDSLPEQTSTAQDHAAYQPEDIYHTRRLNDGQEFRIIKVFYQPDSLQKRLEEAGFGSEVKTTGRYFFYAAARKR
jgi:demethylmenaquinone methyltransferase/2-methoxy-6-polyprenyl-1,4-benzoquinol methylase